MADKKSLGDYIIELFVEVFQGSPKRELRWYEIRNTMLTNEDIPLETRKNAVAFGVKLSRQLESLSNGDILVRHDRGHKNTSYSLSENWQEKVLKEKGLHSYMVTYALDVRPGDTYEQFKRKYLKAWLKDMEKMMEPEMRKRYEEMRRKWVKKHE